MVLNLRIREVLPATPRARIVRIDLNGAAFDYEAGQAVLVGAAGRAQTAVLASPPPRKMRGATAASSCWWASAQTARQGRI